MQRVCTHLLDPPSVRACEVSEPRDLGDPNGRRGEAIEGETGDRFTTRVDKSTGPDLKTDTHAQRSKLKATSPQLPLQTRMFATLQVQHTFWCGN